MSQVRVTQLKIEHYQNTLGIDNLRPRISWQIETDLNNWKQTAYEIVCIDEASQSEHKVQAESEQSVLIDWPFDALKSREKRKLKVRVWGTNDSESDWSEELELEIGLVEIADWQAAFITPDWEEDASQPNPAPYFRKDFRVSKEIASARLYISSLGIYHAEINGKIISDDIFSPGWTVYDERLRYHTYDVADLLKVGENAIGAIVGEGWYRGRLGWGDGQRNIYGDKAGLIAQLDILYADGSSECIITNENWHAATGAILESGIYDGEHFDARLEPMGWSQAGFDDATWSGVKVLEQDLSILEASLTPPVRRTEVLKPVSITKSPIGKTLVDFGQNLVGRLRIRVQGEAGHRITLRHAEVLEDGELGVRPIRRAKATDNYILKGVASNGNSVETYEPYFTFHGFRYAEVEGWDNLTIDDLEAIVIHSDMTRTGIFECSDTQVNQLHQNVIWSMRGNFFDIPTDCPQRDERMGWTGDIQVFTPTASFLYDVSGFLQSWLKDLVIEQERSDGAVPHVVPDILEAGGAAAWADAAVIVPWVLYQRYGDVAILESQFESMRSWVDYVAAKAGEDFLWNTGFQFGDWLDPSAPPDKPFMARTDKRIVASAYFAYSTSLLVKTISLLGKTGLLEDYAALAENAKTAFVREYITPAGRMMSDAETAYSLAIMFELVSDEQLEHAGNRLAGLVRDGGYTIRTGFVGTPLICDALSRTGHHQVAYHLLKQTDCPSWLYPITMGATTIWERWDSMLPDGSINPGEMTSFNHYALGAVADWMHRCIGGLAPAEPAYKRIIISPRPGGGIEHCNTELNTPYGKASCEWQITEGKFDISVTIPPNATALIDVAGTELEPTEVGSGQYTWSLDYDNPDKRAPFTVEDVVGDIMINSDFKMTVLRVLGELNAPDFLPGVLLSDRSMRLREGLEMFKDYDTAANKMNQALQDEWERQFDQ